MSGAFSLVASNGGSETGTVGAYIAEFSSLDGSLAITAGWKVEMGSVLDIVVAGNANTCVYGATTFVVIFVSEEVGNQASEQICFNTNSSVDRVTSF